MSSPPATLPRAPVRAAGLQGLRGAWFMPGAARLRAGPALMLFALLAVAAAVAALSLGAYEITLPRLLAAVRGALLSGLADPSADQRVLFDVRAPRVLLGACTGAALGVAGALMQGLLRNPLADPSLVGVSSGAAFGAALTIVMGPALLPGMSAMLGDWTLMAAAFGVGLLVTALVERISRVGGQSRLAVMLLAGIALNALAMAGIGFLSSIATDVQLRALNFWLLGSLGAARWMPVLVIAAVVLPAVLLVLRLAGELNALALGEAQARLMGVPVDRVKLIGVVAGALAVGAVTSLTGTVGFIGLVAPHLVRLAGGPDHRVVLPGSALLGAALVIAADTAARTWFAPAELPLGVLTAFIGTPLFLALLWQQRERL